MLQLHPAGFPLHLYHDGHPVNNLNLVMVHREMRRRYQTGMELNLHITMDSTIKHCHQIGLMMFAMDSMTTIRSVNLRDYLAECRQPLLQRSPGQLRNDSKALEMEWMTLMMLRRSITAVKRVNCERKRDLI